MQVGIDKSITIWYNAKGRWIQLISYRKLFILMEEKGRNKYYLRNHHFHGNTVSRLVKNQQVNIEIIDRLCKLFDCQPGDIMEYIPDPESEEKE